MKRANSLRFFSRVISPARTVRGKLALLLMGAALKAAAQTSDQPGCSFGAASPATGADVPATYFGPTPSTVQKELVGPLQLLTAGRLDARAALITLPLYRGRVRSTGQTAW